MRKVACVGGFNFEHLWDSKGQIYRKNSGPQMGIILWFWNTKVNHNHVVKEKTIGTHTEIWCKFLGDFVVDIPNKFHEKIFFLWIKRLFRYLNFGIGLQLKTRPHENLYHISVFEPLHNQSQTLRTLCASEVYLGAYKLWCIFWFWILINQSILNQIFSLDQINLSMTWRTKLRNHHTVVVIVKLQLAQ